MSETPTSKPPLEPARTVATPSSAATGAVCSKSNETPFPFMKLSAELRIDIYRHYFDDFSRPKSDVYVLNIGTRRANILPILQACSQIRREAAPILYKECLGGETPSGHGSWLLGEGDEHSTMMTRVDALAELVAAYSPGVEVSGRYLRTGRGSKPVCALVTIRRRSLDLHLQ